MRAPGACPRGRATGSTTPPIVLIGGVGADAGRGGGAAALLCGCWTPFISEQCVEIFVAPRVFDPFTGTKMAFPQHPELSHHPPRPHVFGIAVSPHAMQG